MRAVEALKLRSAKLTYQQIATQCGYADASSCRKAILREMDRCVVKNVDELRTQEAIMLDALHTECWEMAMDKSNRGRLFAIDRLLSISEARRKLLGLEVKDDGQNVIIPVVRETVTGYLQLGESKS
jgi:hypothetical protein